eukprot:4871471-Pyramimonas_sp.AAC.1
MRRIQPLRTCRTGNFNRNDNVHHLHLELKAARLVLCASCSKCGQEVERTQLPSNRKLIDEEQFEFPGYLVEVQLELPADYAIGRTTDNNTTNEQAQSMDNRKPLPVPSRN